MGISDHIPCLPVSFLFVGQEARVRIGYETMDWFNVGEGVCQGYTLSPCLFNLYAGYIIWNAGLDDSQAGIKIAGRNMNNLRYADDTTLVAESEEELRSFLMMVKQESGKSWFTTQHSKNEDHGIQSYRFMANRWEKISNSVRFHFLGLQSLCGQWLQPHN